MTRVPERRKHRLRRWRRRTSGPVLDRRDEPGPRRAALEERRARAGETGDDRRVRRPRRRRTQDPPVERGHRRAALRRRRRRRRALGVLAAAGIVVVGFLGWGRMGDDGAGDSPGDGSSSPTEAATDPVVNMLVFGTREDSPDAPAVWMTLFSYDRDSERGAVVYIPAHTAAEIPGRGLEGVGAALPSGGVPLLLVSAQNLLGIDIDRYLELSDADARVLFEATGPVTVDVPDEVRVPAGRKQERLIFTEGEQRLDSTFSQRLLYTLGVGGDDAELGSRHLAFWHGFFREFADDPEDLQAAFEEAGPALAETDAAAEVLASISRSLAELPSDERIVASLPVEAESVGEAELYRADAAAIADFLDDTIGTGGDAEDEVRVQILNGNGVPGIGQEVAELLVGNGFRVILSGNAPRLNYRRTLIIAYDSSPEGQAIAADARELLGVGEVQVSAQDQGIVDLTIVVGKDFLRTR